MYRRSMSMHADISGSSSTTLALSVTSTFSGCGGAADCGGAGVGAAAGVFVGDEHAIKHVHHKEEKRRTSRIVGKPGEGRKCKCTGRGLATASSCPLALFIEVQASFSA